MDEYGVLQFFSGAITMAYLVAGLFFLKFWKRTGDWLFATFASAFWLLALNQALVALTGLAQEERVWAYLVRLLAFSLIIVGIIAKNLHGQVASLKGSFPAIAMGEAIARGLARSGG